MDNPVKNRLIAIYEDSLKHPVLSKRSILIEIGKFANKSTSNLHRYQVSHVVLLQRNQLHLGFLLGKQNGFLMQCKLK